MDLQPNKTDGIYLPITNTRISASEWNQLVGSCMAFITAAGLTPDASDNEQFLNAFKTIAAGLEIVGANTNLSNLTATGEARFITKADTDLSNVTNTGKSTSAGWAMPNSDTYASLTPGATAASYTAPSNGWMYAVNIPTANGQFLSVYNSANVEIAVMWSIGANTLYVSWPVVKGNSYRINYSSGTLSKVLFFYAEGSKSEAN